MDAGPDKLEALFDAALELPPQERSAYLAKACGEDEELRRRLERLLRNLERAGNFLAQDYVGSPGGTRYSTVTAEKPGDRIGRYKLLEQIGEGGCGVVYMAEQEEPVRRRVALKIIKLGMDTRSVIARFEAERQALALMDHPNIAKVHDAGATESGRPYFVMELVRGTKITDYCDEKSLPTAQRLDLFVKVSQAVQHAHQKGIIHRDLKPSNILVTVNDGVAVPKIIDFGIAKATTDQRLTDKTVFTAFEQFIGTPAYMSPEQAELTSVDVDTRSDIYSLGVLLYELLTSKTPFDSKELLQAGLDEMRRTIREKEPPTPSTRVSTMHGDELTTTAKRRGLEPPKLISQLRGDLDWIVMKCLEKDRARRYGTANSLAMDIQRHLNNEPVVACPPGTAYRLAKFVRRNKGAVLAAGVVATVLVSAAVLSMWQARQQTLLRQQAQSAAAKSQQVAHFLKDMLAGVGPSVARGRDITLLHEVLDKTAERVGKDLTNQPEVEIELRDVLAATYGQLGLIKRMEEMAEANLKLAQVCLGQETAPVANALDMIGEAQRQLGKPGEAEATQRKALALRRRIFGEESAEVAASLNSLSLALHAQGKLAEAESLCREALAMDRKLFGTESPDVATSLNNLGLYLTALGKLAQAEVAYREALAVQRKVLGAVHPDLATTLHNLAAALQREDKLLEAESTAREALAMDRKLFGNEHQTVSYALNTLGNVLHHLGKLADAETAHREALDIRRKLLGNSSLEVAASLNNLAGVLRDEEKLTEAESAFRESLAIMRSLFGEENSQTANALSGLSGVLERAGRDAEAEDLARQSWVIRRKLFGDEHPDSMDSMHRLVSLLLKEAKLSEAQSLDQDLVARLRARLPADDPALAAAIYGLAATLLKGGKLAEAEPLIRECLAVREKRLPDDWRTYSTRAMLGDNLLNQKKYADAEPFLLSGYQGMKDREAKIRGGNRVFLKKALQNLSQLYSATDRPDEAAQWKQKLAEFDSSQANTPPATPTPAKPKP
jgi:hypothetical protein